MSCLYAGYYVAELLSELTDDYDPNAALFDLAEQVLQGLARGDSASNSVLRWELAALAVQGHLPSLDRCVECGKNVPTADRMSFGLLVGGVLCPDCRVGKRQLVSVHGGTIRAMAMLADLQTDAWTRLQMDSRTRGELRGLMNNYLSHLLGHRPRMQEYLTA